MSDNNETLGYLRVVRDGEDCMLSRCEPEDYVLYDGDLEHVDSDWLRKVDYRKAHDHLVTPVRLEPCETHAWRTDVESAPEGKWLLCKERANPYPMVMRRYEGKWECAAQICEHEAPTHWMPLPELPEDK